MHGEKVAIKFQGKARAAAKDGSSQKLKMRGRQIVDAWAQPRHADPVDSPQARVALGRLAEEVVEKISGVEVAQHDGRMRTWSSWPANP